MKIPRGLTGKELRVGTLTNILGDVADHLQIQKAVLISELFGEK